MADKSKKNIYKKTMGFNHNRVNTTEQIVSNATKSFVADVKHTIQQYGSNDSVIGFKERHQPNPPGQYNKFKRPPYKKGKFKGEKDAYRKSVLSGQYGNQQVDPNLFEMTGKARRKLVKGT